jgi:DNA-binding GntR family transcriptional regulator
MRSTNPTPKTNERVRGPRPSVLVREKTVNALREAILSLELKPGQRLVEREFIDRLGVSRTTFREALRQLSSEGLVTVVPQKGARVSSPSLDEATDLYQLRAALESLVVVRFIERATPEEVVELRGTIEEFDLAVSLTTDTKELLDAKEGFYRVLLRGARSAVLEQTLAGIQARVRVLRSRSLSKPGRALETASELRAIVEAIEAGDADLASDLCARHVHTAGAIALVDLASRDGAGRSVRAASRS